MTKSDVREFILSHSNMSVVLADGQTQEFRVASSVVDNVIITGDHTRVIERSAYEALKKELFTERVHSEYIEAELEQLKRDCGTCSAKRDTLKLKEALMRIAKGFGTDYCDGNTMIAKEALEKLKEG
jgi:hypothetical protein